MNLLYFFFQMFLERSKHHNSTCLGQKKMNTGFGPDLNLNLRFCVANRSRKSRGSEIPNVQTKNKRV